MNLSEWERTSRAVTLTNDQWSTLTCYILMSTKHRESERKAWEELSTEKREDGTPRFPNAADNAKYYRELEDKLTAIRLKIDE
jgi:hypothetical protein